MTPMKGPNVTDTTERANEACAVRCAAGPMGHDGDHYMWIPFEFGDGRVPIYLATERAAAPAEPTETYRLALERIKAWSRWHKEEARTQLRGTMCLIHDQALAALAAPQDPPEEART